MVSRRSALEAPAQDQEAAHFNFYTSSYSIAHKSAPKSLPK